jgi:poly(ADP-ribose) glycohydrolase
VATGNWGCGAFRGDPQLKSLVQLMAASVCHRDIVYFTFDDKRLCRGIREMYNYLKFRNTTVGQLYEKLVDYGSSKRNLSMKLFDFLIQSFERDNVDQVSML